MHTIGVISIIIGLFKILSLVFLGNLIGEEGIINPNFNILAAN